MARNRIATMRQRTTRIRFVGANVLTNRVESTLTSQASQKLVTAAAVVTPYSEMNMNRDAQPYRKTAQFSKPSRCRP